LYDDPSIFESKEAMDGFISAVEKFYHGDYDKQNQVLNDDVHKFKDQVVHFSKSVALAGCKDFDFSLGMQVEQLTLIFRIEIQICNILLSNKFYYCASK
jgi:hypothetical protein